MACDLFLHAAMSNAELSARFSARCPMSVHGRKREAASTPCSRRSSSVLAFERLAGLAGDASLRLDESFEGAS